MVAGHSGIEQVAHDHGLTTSVESAMGAVMGSSIIVANALRGFCNDLTSSRAVESGVLAD